MLLHYGITHAPFVLLAGVSLLAFAAGLLLGTRLDSQSATDTSDSANVEQ